MSHYCGIDLHSNNHVVVVIDEADKRLLEKRLDNNLSLTLRALACYRETLHGVLNRGDRLIPVPLVT